MRKGAFPILAIALAAMLCYGLIRLFAIRFAGGDIYPPYSSLRADGIGTKVLHNSLAELMPVERSMQPIPKLRADAATTIFLAGVSSDRTMLHGHMDELETLLHGGTRAVVTFLPQDRKPLADEEEEDGKDEKGKVDDWQKLWGVTPAFFGKPEEHAKTSTFGLEPEISWHSLMYFEGLDAAWHTIYSCKDKPVIIERSIGRGSLVLVADSYPISNEALSKERAPLLLSMLAGDARRVVFEETHLGIHEKPGVATLVRMYRLHGIVIALLVVAGLFVWRNAVSFVPPAGEHPSMRDIVSGRDAASGFVSLLKRNVPPRELLRPCLAEWKRACSHRVKPALVTRVEAVAEAGVQQPVKTFQTITQILNEKK